MAETLFFQDMGKGQPVIFLHAYALDHRVWLPVARELQEFARLILPDLRGHGSSPVPQGKYSMQEMAEDILKLVDDLSVEQAILAGNSMGGYVAMAFASYFPDRLSGLALVASHVYADPPDKRSARLADIEKLKNTPTAEVLSGMAEKLSHQPQVLEFCRGLIAAADPVGMMGVLGAMADRPDSSTVFADLDIPAVIIAGQEDQFIPIETSRQMAQLMKRSNIIEIAHAGHLPMLDAPQLTSQALKEFIQSI